MHQNEGVAPREIYCRLANVLNREIFFSVLYDYMEEYIITCKDRFERVHVNASRKGGKPSWREKGRGDERESQTRLVS